MSTKSPQLGFTLVELMIALMLGVFLIGGLAVMVVQTGQSGKTQKSLSRMQENGRFALAKIVADLRMAGAQYCSVHSSDMPVGQFNRARPILSFADGAMPWGLPTRAQVRAMMLPATVATNAEPYPISPRYFVQGHECTAVANCNPLLNLVGAAVPEPPVAGVNAGNRSRAADVLTVRYLIGNGVPIERNYGSSSIAPFPAVNASPNYSTAVAMPPLNFANTDLAMVTDCKAAAVFEATYAGNAVTPSDTNDSDGTFNDIGTFTTTSDNPLPTDVDGDARLFNFTKDFRTVTYYLALRNDADDPTRRISMLMRQVNGVAQPIVDGVERLEIQYGVENSNGTMRFMTANQIQAEPTTSCLPFPDKFPNQEPGCLWRSVRSIDVALLLNSVQNDAGSETERYSFSPTNEVEVQAPAVLPSGLPRGRMFRREFRTTVFLRNSGI